MRREAAVGQVRGRLADDAFGDLVGVEACVAVDPAALGGDDVRRVARDQVERSPSTGSKRLPCRHSTFVSPLSAAFSSVNASARALTSVAITRPAWRREQRVHTAAGADVERGGHAPPRRERVEEARVGE